MRIDINGIIAAAVFLDREEEDVCSWELGTERLSFGLADATPAELASRCASLATLQVQAEALDDVSGTVRMEIDARHGQAAHPDVRPAIDGQADHAARLGQRMLQLRRRMIDLSLELGRTIRELQEEETGTTLIRLFGNLGEPIAEDEMAASATRDRRQVDGAMAAWRALQGDRTPHEDRAPVTVGEVRQALLRLEADNMARRHARPLRRRRWTVRLRPLSRVQDASEADVTRPGLRADTSSRWPLLNAA